VQLRQLEPTAGRPGACGLADQVAADGVPSVPLTDHVTQPVGLAQPGGGAEDVADCDRAAEHRGGSWRTGSSVRATRSSYQARICGQSWPFTW
jgi:hypothetical protein